MKILLFVIAGLVLVVLWVVVTGALLPKAHVASRRAVFRAKQQDLFTMIAGPQGWRSDVTGYVPVADPGGRELVRETTRNGETITYELLDKEPPNGIKRRIATEGLPYAGTWTFTLQPGSDGTVVVRITENGEVYNPVFRFMSRFVIGHTSSMDAYLRSLGNALGQGADIGN
jgi:hypothetical protein